MVGQPPFCPCGSGLPERDCGPRHDRVCPDCGQWFWGRSNRAKRCPVCRLVRNRDLSRGYNRAHRERKKLEQQAAKHTELSRTDPCECGSGRQRRYCDPTPITSCVDCGARFHRHSSTHARCGACAAARAFEVNRGKYRRRKERLRLATPEQLNLGLGEASDAVTKSGGEEPARLDITPVDVAADSSAGAGEGGDADA